MVAKLFWTAASLPPRNTPTALQNIFHSTGSDVSCHFVLLHHLPLAPPPSHNLSIFHFWSHSSNLITWMVHMTGQHYCLYCCYHYTHWLLQQHLLWQECWKSWFVWGSSLRTLTGWMCTGNQCSAHLKQHKTMMCALIFYIISSTAISFQSHVQNTHQGIINSFQVWKVLWGIILDSTSCDWYLLSICIWSLWNMKIWQDHQSQKT